MPSHAVVEDDPCPVSDDFLGDLYRSSEHGLRALIETVSPEVRGLLALYCHRRGHLTSIGLAIAASCEEHDLVAPGGHAGAVLYAKSREALRSTPHDPHMSGRRKITLATGQLLNMVPADDELDEDAFDDLLDDVGEQTEIEVTAGALDAMQEPEVQEPAIA